MATICVSFMAQSGKAIIDNAIEEIYVDFYPGSAKVVVKGVPAATTTTPGILRLSKGASDLMRAGSFYEIQFIKGEFRSQPVFVRAENKSRAYYCLACIPPLIPVVLCAGWKGHLVNLRPKTILVIDKFDAESEGKIEPLIPALKSEIAWVRADAAEALGNIGGAGAVQALIEALSDEIPDVRAKVAEALGKGNDPRGIVPLINVLRDRNLFVWTHAVEALSRIKSPQTVQLMAETLKDKQPQVRRGAALALGGMQDTSAVDPLIRALVDTDEHVQRCAINGLLYLGDPRAVGPLIQVVRRSKSMDVLHEASECLWAAGGNSAAVALAQVLTDQDRAARTQAAFALGQMGPLAAETIPLLIHSLAGEKLNLVKTSEYGITVITQPGGYFEAKAAANLDYLCSYEGIKQVTQEKIEDRMRGGPGYSPTQAAALTDYLVSSLFASIEESQKKKKERKRLMEQAKQLQAEELESQYGTEYVRVKDVSAKVEGDAVTTVAKCEVNAVPFALSRITGEDFGSAKEKWQQWWKENKDRF